MKRKADRIGKIAEVFIAQCLHCKRDAQVRARVKGQKPASKKEEFT